MKGRHASLFLIQAVTRL